MSVQFHRAPPITAEFQFRALANGSSAVEGYAALYNQPSKPIVDELSRGGRPYTEVIAPGSFRRTLNSTGRKSFVVDHDERLMISSAPDGALRMAEDTTGLHFDSPWPRTDYADNARALHEAGEPLGMSLLFKPPRVGANGQPGEVWDGFTARRIQEAILKHISVLATLEPAYAGPALSFRALAAMTEAEVEDVDAVMEALREGRRLDDGEYNLLTKLTEAVKPEASVESAAPVAEPPIEDADRALLERWKKRLEEMEAALPKVESPESGTTA